MMTKLLRVLIINFFVSMAFPDFSAGGTYTNGVYCEQGKTIEIDKSVHEFTPSTKPDVLYFSNDLIVKVKTNADFTVNSFFQEVLNTNKTPEKLKSTTHNFASTILKGSCIVTYNGGDENSSCVISTPFTDHELSRGTYYFEVTPNRVVVFTIDGKLKTTTDNGKSSAITPFGYAVIAMNNENNGILESKVSLYTDKLKQAVADKLITESKEITDLQNSIMFIRIDGKTTGVVIN